MKNPERYKRDTTVACAYDCAVIPGTVHSCVDPTTGQPAFSFFTPEGWQAHSNVLWNTQNPKNPITPSATLQAPDGGAWMALLPNAVFGWADGGGIPEGAMDLSTPILRPRPPAEYLTTVLLPRLRPAMTGLRVVHTEPEPTPPWPSQLAQPVAPGDDSARITIEYTVLGLACREVTSMVCRVGEASLVPTMWGMALMRYWTVYPPFSVGAVIDQWDQQVSVLETIRSSFRIEPGWIQAVQTMITPSPAAAQMQQQQWFANQQALHQQQVAMGDDMVRSGEERSQAMDRLFNRDGW